MAEALPERVTFALRRHRLAVRTVAIVALMLAAAVGVNAVWRTTLGNVIAGLLVVFASALGLLGVVVGATIALHRVRRTRLG